MPQQKKTIKDKKQISIDNFNNLINIVHENRAVRAVYVQFNVYINEL